MMFVIFKDNFTNQLSRSLVKTVKYNLVFVRPLSKLRLSFCTTYVTNANMAVTLAQFLAFHQNEEKCIKKGKNHHKYGHVKGCS